MSSKTEASSSSIGFCGLLTIVFIVLKLTHVIDWSWWSVTAPLWAPIMLVIAIWVLFFVTVFLWSMFVDYRNEQRRKKRLAK